MVYMSGPCETIAQLRELEGYEGSLEDYFKKCNEVNGGIYSSSNDRLKPFYPHILVTEPPQDPEGMKQAVFIIKNFSQDERVILQKLQEEGTDFLTQICMADIMEDAREFAGQFRKKLDIPLVTTPWALINESTASTTRLDAMNAFAGVSQSVFEHSFPLKPLDILNKNMVARDAASRELQMIRSMKGVKNPALILRAQNLQAEIRLRTGEIKRLLPKSMKTKLPKYLGKRFSHEQIRKIRINSYSAKLARRGVKSSNIIIQSRTVTSELQFMSKSGLERLSKSLKHVKSFGKGVGRGCTVLSVGVVAYDTYEAYQNDGNVMKTFSSGMAGFGAAAGVGYGVSTLGAVGIGALAGEVGLSGALLVCTPVVGWVVLGVAGLVAAGVAAHYASKSVEYLWEPENRKEAWEYVKSAASTVEDAIIEAWVSSRDWVYGCFYGGA